MTEPQPQTPKRSRAAADGGDGGDGGDGHMEPAPRGKEKDKNGKGSVLACFLGVASQAHATGVFVICFWTTAVYGGYRLEAICPVSNFGRLVLNLVSPLAFASQKAWFADVCNDEDTIWRFFYDLWPKTLVTGTDSYAQIAAGAIGFWGLFKTARLLLFIYSAAIAYAMFSTTLLLLQLMGSSLFVWHSTGASLVSACSAVIRIANLPLTLTHAYVCEPIGRFVCSLPSRALGLLGQRAPLNPLYVFTFMAERNAHSDGDAADGDDAISAEQILSPTAIWGRIRRCGGAIVQWFITAFVLCTVARVCFTAAGGGSAVVWVYGLLSNPFGGATAAAEYVALQKRTYHALTYGGVGDALFLQVLWQTWDRVVHVLRHPSAWAVMAAIVAVSAGIQWTERRTDSASGNRKRSVALRESAASAIGGGGGAPIPAPERLSTPHVEPVGGAAKKG